MPKDYPVSAFFNQADVTFSVPSTVEDFDNAVGETGACLDGAIDDTMYRHTLPRLYSAVSKVLTESFSFPKEQAIGKNGEPVVRSTKSKGDVPVLEADLAHLSRYFETGDDEAKRGLIGLLQSTAASLPFYDKTAPSASRGPAKVSKAGLEAANTYVAAGPERVEKVAAFIEGQVLGYKVTREEDGTISAEGLGRAIDALGRFEQQKAKAARDAALAALG